VDDGNPGCRIRQVVQPHFEERLPVVEEAGGVLVEFFRLAKTKRDTDARQR
jgi:hypothetical protein